jgi:hypothetical protein
MLRIALQSARPSVLTARAGHARPAAFLRALSTSAIRRSDDHHASAPTIFGVGAKPGETPTDQSQSTGLDRVQVLGLLEGVDVFDLEPLDSSRIGTLADPVKVFSAVRRPPSSFSTFTVRLSYLVVLFYFFAIRRTRNVSSVAPVHLPTRMTSYGSV